MAERKGPEPSAHAGTQLPLDSRRAPGHSSVGAEQRRIGAVENGRSLTAFATAPYLSSARSQWDGILCEQYRLSDYANEGKTYLNHHLCIHMAGPTPAYWYEKGRKHNAFLKPWRYSSRFGRERDPRRRLRADLRAIRDRAKSRNLHARVAGRRTTYRGAARSDISAGRPDFQPRGGAPDGNIGRLPFRASLRRVAGGVTHGLFGAALLRVAGKNTRNQRRHAGASAPPDD